MTALHDLYTRAGQSPWIDDLRRSYVTEGGLAALIEKGIRGLTSNPTIMARSMEAGTDYDAQLAELDRSGASVVEAYWELLLFDARGALSVLRPLYEESDGGDGFVSVEVAPDLAHDTDRTLQAARELSMRVDEPNLLVKIPATLEGIPAIEAMIAEGRNVTVTLIFSLERYDAVIEAYLSGLERLVAAGGDPSRVASVASFFVSRVDTEIDHRLDAIAAGSPGTALGARAPALRGRAAVAQARLAYALFSERFTSPRFEALAAHGARVQRPLWASTSTKDPAYPDLMYVEELIGPDTVNTMPSATLEAFLDHGRVRRSVDGEGGTGPARPDAPTTAQQARADLDAIGELGISLEEVAALLEREGVASFQSSFDEVLASLSAKVSSR